MVNYYINRFENKPLIATDLEGNFIGRYNNRRECQRSLNIPNKSSIDNNLTGKTLRCQQYIIMYEENYNKEKLVTYKKLLFKKKAQKGLINTSIKRNTIIK